MNDKRIGEQHGDLTIIAKSVKKPNGYLPYFYCICACGNVKRYRYDQVRKKGNCGECADFKESNVCSALEVHNNGKI